MCLERRASNVELKRDCQFGRLCHAARCGVSAMAEANFQRQQNRLSSLWDMAGQFDKTECFSSRAGRS
jgi:hypothetical protein